MDPEAVSKVAQHCNTKKSAAKLAQESSQHLFLCTMISDLTQKYGPVMRQATVIGVLDQAFDVVVSEFGIEKRVHADQMPIEVSRYSVSRCVGRILMRRAYRITFMTNDRTHSSFTGRRASMSSSSSLRTVATHTFNASRRLQNSMLASWNRQLSRPMLRALSSRMMKLKMAKYLKSLLLLPSLLNRPSLLRGLLQYLKGSRLLVLDIPFRLSKNCKLFQLSSVRI